MSTFTDRYVIVFNVEIYNALEIKKKYNQSKMLMLNGEGIQIQKY